MNTVFGIDLEDAHGSTDSVRPTGWSPNTGERCERFAEPIRTLLDRLAVGERIEGADTDGTVVVPDVHYPFHPSTGMVADPAVVGALVEALERASPGRDVAVAGSSTHLGFERTVDYLGYPSALERVRRVSAGDVPIIDLTESTCVGRTVHVDGERVSVSIPAPLVDRTVLVAPSLRPTRAGPVAGAMRTLGRCLAGGGDAGAEPETAVAATRAVDPAGALLDATTAYAGHPVAAGALLAGECVSIDAVAADLLGRDPAADAVLQFATGTESFPVSVDGLAYHDLHSRLPSGGTLPATGDPHPAITRAYRLYAAASGDVVPPQLERASRDGVRDRTGERSRDSEPTGGRRGEPDR
ncbi:DUF362 domain-containing protein [Halobacteria archaeon AArc-m2/3/4]|uniref:DUF362 domain-containing protein n=1 Tax=Natronoglomus mannanivorans TaxID=2979990 RepID=A0AAP2Z045_9EURY|nr:DUF362 domain-containing protein [Halobacteria archaeon AArc-xg1-1]MCU4974190.1 DUF362 domain-containing protein [Halobacteria archaeon AArc-m2/3/4]